MSVLALLALGFGSVIFVLSSSVAESRRVQGGLRAFYACDSAIRIASAVAQNVVLANPKKTSEEVTVLAMDAVCQAAGGCIGTPEDCPLCSYRAQPGTAAGPDALMPDNANMEVFSLRVFPMVSTRAIQFGAFRDLNATQSLVAISTQGIDTSTGTVASAREMFSMASVSPFQMMAFSTAPLSWIPLRPRLAPASTTSMGRMGPSVYAGGSLTVGGGSPLQLLRAVSAGKLIGGADVAVWDANVGDPHYAALVAPDERRSYSIRTPLRLTTTPGRTPGQPADEAPTSARWLLDPPGPADTEAVIQGKLAGQADIRIIDGVWFIKPPPNDTTTPSWPGIPVWSDHAGAGVVPSTLEEQALMQPPSKPAPAIGQADLALAHSWSSVPRRYSYYEANMSGHLQETPTGTGPRDGVGVVSYGMLSVRSGRLVPGYSSSGGGGGGIGPVCINVLKTFSRLLPFDDACNPSVAQSTALGLLDGARQGFRDVSAAAAAAQTPPAMHPHVLPLNFDVAQFISAMLDGGKGELGSYFCGVGDASNPLPGCRRFNGIVYITATWPGSLKGLVDDTVPDRAPLQGSTVATADLLQPAANYQNFRYWLPRQLCGAKTLGHTAVAPSTHDGLGVSPGPYFFPIVGCDPDPATPFERAYVDAAGPRAGVNAVRIINGRDLSRLLDVQPQPDNGPTLRDRLGGLGGLSIVSSLPVYVYGDWNVVPGPLQNDASIVCPPGGGPNCGFPRSLVGGDRLTFLSRVGNCTSAAPGFNDSCARWQSGGGGSTIAAPTFFSGAFMSGLSPTVASENVETLFRVNETWPMTAQPTLTVVGSLFAVGRAYYQPEPRHPALTPALEWRFLSALAEIDQPPGSPSFIAGITSRWRDLR
jgi:hypothetical protein